MRVYESKIIPFKGYLAINIFGWVFTSDIVKFMSKKSYFTHEQIHTEQYKELWYVGFFFVYLWYYIKYLIKYLNHRKAYARIPLEIEAYSFDLDPEYPYKRKKFAWKQYRL